MTRTLYRCLLWLHPAAFRQEFAGEMLWIFEKASLSDGAAPLLADGLVSLARQWLLRTESWKWVVAVLGGMLQVTAGGLGALLFGPRPMLAHLPGSRWIPPAARDPRAAIAMNDFMPVACAVLTGVLLMVVILTLWVKRLNAGRA
jgi:hypothetical protein